MLNLINGKPNLMKRRDSNEYKQLKYLSLKIEEAKSNAVFTEKNKTKQYVRTSYQPEGRLPAKVTL